MCLKSVGLALEDLGLAGSSSVEEMLPPLSLHLYHIKIRQACLHVELLSFSFFFRYSVVT